MIIDEEYQVKIAFYTSLKHEVVHEVYESEANANYRFNRPILFNCPNKSSSFKAFHLLHMSLKCLKQSQLRTFFDNNFFSTGSGFLALKTV